jgi:uncharacterized protein YjiS (DUF1127 family)
MLSKKSEDEETMDSSRRLEAGSFGLEIGPLRILAGRIVRGVKGLFLLIREERRLRRSRRELARLDDHMLRDIGLLPEEATRSSELL